MTGEQDQTINFIRTVSFVTEVCELGDKTDTDHIPTLSLGWGVPSLHYVKHRIAPGMRTVERIRPNILREGNIFDELTSGSVVTSYQELLGLCGRMRSLSILVLSLTIVVRKGEEVQLTIPGGDLEDGLYRLDYRPPVGRPQLSADGRVTFTGARAGTEYQFYLYYSNSSISDLLTKTFTTVTAPAPARDLTTKVARTAALVRWRPPVEGRFTGFRLRLVPVTPVATGSRVLATNQSGIILTGLRAGATYRVEVLTVLEDKESLTFLSTLLNY